MKKPKIPTMADVKYTKCIITCACYACQVQKKKTIKTIGEEISAKRYISEREQSDRKDGMEYELL